MSKYESLWEDREIRFDLNKELVIIINFFNMKIWVVVVFVKSY